MIFDFAAKFDPQPYHLDQSAAEASFFGGLCASGWQVATLATQLTGEVLLEAGIPFIDLTSIEKLKWEQPTFVDEFISVEITLGERSSESTIPLCDNLSVEISVLSRNSKVLASLLCNVAIDRTLA